MASDAQAPSSTIENSKEGKNESEDIIFRLEAIWNHLTSIDAPLTVAWAIYTLGQVINRLDSIGINLGLEDEIGALTLLLEESEEPLITQWGAYKAEIFSLLTVLRESLQDADPHEKNKDPSSGGQSNGS